MVRLSDALLLDLREWGVMLRQDGEGRYGARVVSDLIGGDFLALHDTPLGPALVLGAKGRRRVGFVGRYSPDTGAVLNQLAVWDARAQFEGGEGFTHITPRLHGKYMFTVTRERGTYRRTYAVAARYTSFDFRAVRLLYRRLFVDEPEEPLPSGLLVFIPPEDVEDLRAEVAPKKVHRPFLVPRRVLRILALPRPRPTPGPSVSGAASPS